MRTFKSLSEQEILALAISLEEEDARVYDDFADGLKSEYPATAAILQEMRAEENGHRHRLLELYRQKFGEHIPLIRRQDVKGFVSRRPIWLVRPLGLAAVRKHIEVMEFETKRFYESAQKQAGDVGIRQLLGDLAEEERKHSLRADALESEHIASGAEEQEAGTRNRLFVLQVIQPGLAGLMDGSVSTLAPLFATAFARASSWETFLVGMAASLGAGISMGFAEALSDDGSLTGRGRPRVRGLVCGLMTALGGIGHALPYLIGYLGQHPHRQCHRRRSSCLFELGIIASVRHRFMDTPWTSAIVQIVIGGLPGTAGRHSHRHFVISLRVRSAAPCGLRRHSKPRVEYPTLELRHELPSPLILKKPCAIPRPCTIRWSPPCRSISFARILNGRFTFVNQRFADFLSDARRRS